MCCMCDTSGVQICLEPPALRVILVSRLLLVFTFCSEWFHVSLLSIIKIVVCVLTTLKISIEIISLHHLHSHFCVNVSCALVSV